MAGNKQSANLHALLRKLNKLGSRVDLLVAEEEEEVEITQVGSLYGAQLLELESGRTGYILYVAIVNQTSRPVYCVEIELRPPWSDSYFDWLPDPQERRRDAHHYSFPGRGAPEFPRDLVLNHFLLSEEKRCVLTPHIPYEGWLLAVGGPLPGDLRHRQWVEATLAIIASDHTEYTETISFIAERRAVKPKFAKRERSVYEAPKGCSIESVGSDRIVPIQGADSTDSSADSESDIPNRPSRPRLA